MAAGAILAAGHTGSTASALEAAGFAASTARQPAFNGLTPQQLIRDHAEASLPATTLRALDRKALRKMDELLDSPQTADSTAAGLALGVAKIRRELEPDAPDDDQASKLRAIAEVRFNHAACVLAGLRIAAMVIVRAGIDVPPIVSATLDKLQRVRDARYVRYAQAEARERGDGGMVRRG